MRKSIVILLFFIALGAKAQGNLQFNQVLTYTEHLSVSCLGSCSVNSPIWTVPANKVWKIEARTATPQVIGSYGAINFVINSIVYSNEINVTTNAEHTNPETIWLKAGDKINFNVGGNCNGCTGYPTYGGDYFISIIEFNVVQ